MGRPLNIEFPVALYLMMMNRKNLWGNAVRKTAIYLVQRYCSIKNEEIGKIFGEMHGSAISIVSARFKEGLARNNELARLVKKG